MSFLFFFRLFVASFIYNVYKYMRITPCEGIQDSLGFWIPRLGFRIPGTGFLNLCQWNLDSGFQWLVGFRIPSTVFWIPKPRIADSTGKKFAGLRIPRQTFFMVSLSTLIFLKSGRCRTGFFVVLLPIELSFNVCV